MTNVDQYFQFANGIYSMIPNGMTYPRSVENDALYDTLENMQKILTAQKSPAEDINKCILFIDKKVDEFLMTTCTVAFLNAFFRIDHSFRHKLKTIDEIILFLRKDRDLRVFMMMCNSLLNLHLTHECRILTAEATTEEEIAKVQLKAREFKTNSKCADCHQILVEDETLYFLSCGHHLHVHCLESWLKSFSDCNVSQDWKCLKCHDYDCKFLKWSRK